MSQSKCGKKYQTYCQQKTAAAELESSRRTTERDDTTVATELIADLIDDLERALNY
jgi:molecular chaperone GrpE (heat shock protein)